MNENLVNPTQGMVYPPKTHWTPVITLIYICVVYLVVSDQWSRVMAGYLLGWNETNLNLCVAKYQNIFWKNDTKITQLPTRIVPNIGKCSIGINSSNAITTWLTAEIMTTLYFILWNMFRVKQSIMLIWWMLDKAFLRWHDSTNGIKQLFVAI